MAPGRVSAPWAVAANVLMPKTHCTCFSIDGEVSCTCCGLVSDMAKSAASRCNGIWETNDTMDSTQLVTDWSFMLWTCYGEVDNLLRGKWCNGFWPESKSTRAFKSHLFNV